MYDFDSLVQEVLRNRPEMTRDGIIELIKEKKRNVGGGYLTDQGALFLIAGELGVQLKHLTSTDLTLKDLYVGANDITIVARVLAVYPVNEFKKKDGSGVGRYRRVNLFDRDNVVRLTIWDDNQDAIRLEGIVENSPVRVSNGYVKQGLDGKPNLNLGKRGRIELLTDQALVGKLIALGKLAKKVDDIGDDVNILALECVTSSNSRSSNFTREDGSQGSLTQFDVSDEGGKNKMRVVIWNPVTPPEVKAGQSLMITNLRLKRASNGERELHGDNGTVVRVNETKATASARFTKVSQLKGSSGHINLEVMVLSRGMVNETNLRDGGTAKKAELLVGDDTGEVTIVGWRNAAQILSEMNVGQKLRMFGVVKETSKMGIEILRLEDTSKVEKL